MMNLEAIIRLAKQGKGHEALSELKNFIELNSTDQQALFYAGMWSFQSMDWKNAECYMLKLHALAPTNIDYIVDIHGMYMNMSNYKAAIIFQKKMVELTNNNGKQLYNLAMLYHRIYDFDNALKIFNNLNEQYPNNVQIIGVVADIEHGFGYFDKAIAYYEKALKINPLDDSAFNGIIKSKKYKQVDLPLLEHGKMILSSTKTSPQTKAQINISLGKMFDDCQDYTTAWQYYCQGNNIQKSLFPHHQSPLNEQVKIIKNIFNEQLFDNKQASAKSDHQPIFIVGMPRSGTTLLEQVLEHSGKTCAGGESPALNKAINNQFYKIKYPDELASVKSETYEKLANDYLSYFKNCHINGELRSVDKLPGNFLHLGLLKKMFPNIKIINLSRNKFDCSLSIFFQLFADHMTFTTDIDDIFHFYKIYQEMMSHWQTLFPENIFNIAYEDFVNDFENKTKAIYEFLALDWNDKVGDFVDSKNSVQTPSSWQVRQGINNKSVGRSENYLTLMNTNVLNKTKN